MKNIYIVSILAMIVLGGSQSLYAQSLHIPGKAPAGTWQMDADAVLAHLGQAERNTMDNQRGAQPERFKSSLASRIFEFAENGNFSAIWEANEQKFSVHGKWTREGEGKIRIVFPDGVSEYLANFPSPDRMVLEPLDSSGGMLKTLFFIKTGDR
jgi:hypothetical protein